MSDPSGALDECEIYKQINARYLNMNDTLYKIPPFFATVVGGLWYFAMQHAADQRLVACGVFVFAALVSMTGWRLVVRRIGPRIDHYQVVTKAYEDRLVEARVRASAQAGVAGTAAPTGEEQRPTGRHSVEIIGDLMLGAAMLSVAGAVLVAGQLLTQPASAKPACCCGQSAADQRAAANHATASRTASAAGRGA